MAPIDVSVARLWVGDRGGPSFLPTGAPVLSWSVGTQIPDWEQASAVPRAAARSDHREPSRRRPRLTARGVAVPPARRPRACGRAGLGGRYRRVAVRTVGVARPGHRAAGRRRLARRADRGHAGPPRARHRAGAHRRRRPAGSGLGDTLGHRARPVPGGAGRSGGRGRGDDTRLDRLRPTPAVPDLRRHRPAGPRESYCAGRHGRRGLVRRAVRLHGRGHAALDRAAVVRRSAPDGRRGRSGHDGGDGRELAGERGGAGHVGRHLPGRVLRRAAG